MKSSIFEITDCVFCQIIAGKLPLDRVFEDQRILAFHDIHPLAPVHVLIIPKRHIASLAGTSDSDAMLLGRIQTTARVIAKKAGVAAAFRLTAASGRNAGQTVFHLHYHLTGGWKGGISSWRKEKKFASDP